MTLKKPIKIGIIGAAPGTGAIAEAVAQLEKHRHAVNMEALSRCDHINASKRLIAAFASLGTANAVRDSFNAMHKVSRRTVLSLENLTTSLQPFIKQRLPRKQKKAFIKKHGRLLYHTTFTFK